MKVIIENWNRFLNEDKKTQFLEQFMAIDLPMKDWAFALLDQEFNVAAIMQLRAADRIAARPCIPKTYDIAAIAVADKHRGKGMGSYMYDLAAFKAKEMGGGDAGITSDRIGKTSDDAKPMWDRLSIKYKKRKTNKGSDTFDYTGKQTPDDPDDDCRHKTGVKPPTDHSWEGPSNLISRASKIYNNQKKNLENRKNMLPKDLESRLMNFWNSFGL